jgi:hypothetical protein
MNRENAMVAGAADGKPVRTRFSGTRRELGLMLVRSYLLLIPTIGLYRFWLTTWKRRFYWSHTEIDGDCLEYTGNASQLLLGFLMAVAILVPLYGLFFYFSTLSTQAAIIGYGGVAVLVWFLMGYAAYRARDFRLSRTLWRGIRCDQGGSAWIYALRRFLWSLLVIATVGLAYPLMAADLWAYRYRHSWFGDQTFGFVGHWRQLAEPFYRAYALIALIGGIGISTGWARGAFAGQPDPAAYWPLVLAALLAGMVFLYYRARELTRMFSAVRLGGATLTVTVRARSLFGQHVVFGLALVGSYAGLALGGIIVLGLVAAGSISDGQFNLDVLVLSMQASLVTLLAIIFGYLLLLAAFNLMAELFLSLGLWKLVVQNASIAGIETLDKVRARGEDRALAGEGLADALNVGAY